MQNRLLKAVQGQLKHGKDLPDLMDGPGVGPFFNQFRIDPDRMGKGLRDELQPLIAWPSRPLFNVDGPIRRHELIGSHACIAHNNESRFRVQADKLVNGNGFECLGGSSQR